MGGCEAKAKIVAFTQTQWLGRAHSHVRLATLRLTPQFGRQHLPRMAAPGRSRRRQRPTLRSWASMTVLLAAAVSLGTHAAHATTTMARRSSSSLSRRRIAGPGACWLPGFMVGSGHSHPHCIRSAVRPRQVTQRWSSSDSASPSGTSTTTPSPATSSAAVSDEPTRPPTLPSQEFKPKQSLGQNFLSDQNYVLKIVTALVDSSPGGRQVVELGPGPGALTRVLHRRYPEMLAVEIDSRAVAVLNEALPNLRVVQSDVLQVDWTALAELRGGPLSVIGNLPYHITSQILFCLLDNHRAVRQAVVTMQLEVAQRIIAPTRCKDYGILSVLFQLYTKPRINFKLPPTVFYPQPKVTSALVTLDFLQPAEGKPLFDVDPAALKQVLNLSFQQRRKMLRQSLKGLLAAREITLDEEWATKRPEELEPAQFVELTKLLFGPATAGSNNSRFSAANQGQGEQTRVWRRARHGGFEEGEEEEE